MDYIFSRRKPKVGDRGFIIGNRFVPIHNNLKMPKEGLVFYESLTKESFFSETGQELVKKGSISFTRYKRVPCACFDSSSIETKNNFTEISGSNSTFTASIWGCMPNGYNGVQTLLFFGNDNNINGNGCVLFAMENKLFVTNIGTDLGYIYLDVQNWFHLLATYNGSNFNLYINGNYVAGPSSFNTRMRIGKLCIGRWNRTDVSYFYGYLSSARIYNRVLTQEEITLLSQEFKI